MRKLFIETINTATAVLVLTSFPLLIVCNGDSQHKPALETMESRSIEDTAQCVLKLSAKYFVDKRALSGSIVIININSYVSITQKILLETIHSGIKYSIMVKDSLYPHYNASHFPEKAKNYMLILEEKDELRRNILQLNKLPTWNPHAKAIVFYELRENDNVTKTVKHMINELREYKLFKSIVLIYTPDTEEITSYTWKPYSDTACGSKCKEIYVLDKCFKSQITQHEVAQEMFPLNLKGCPLVVYAVVCEPYVMPPTGRLNKSGYEDAYDFHLGIEVNLLKIISYYSNTTLIIRMSTTPENWGDIAINGSASGMYSVLRNDSADVIIGNMQVDRNVRKWFDPTSTYMQDEITWCVPKAGAASTWSNLVAIFTWTTWIATLASLVAMAGILHYCYYTENNRTVSKWPTNSFLMTFGMLLGWGALFKPQTITFRVLILTWLLFSINLSISYESFLRSFLIHPRFEKQIANENDIIESKIEFGGRDAFKKYFDSVDPTFASIFKKYNTTLFEEGIERAALKRNFAIVSSRRQGEYQDQKIGKGAGLIFCFEERNILYKYGVVILTRKWFPMLNRFNEIIRGVFENGLIWKWNSEVFIHNPSTTDTSDSVPLGTQHLLGAFMFIMLMYGVCILVFVLEVVTVKYSKNN